MSEEEKPLTKEKLMEFFDIYISYQNLFEATPRLKTALNEYIEKGDKFLEGKMRLRDFDLPDDFNQ